MSAFIVSDNHINALVQALEQWSRASYIKINTAMLNRAAQTLLNENYRSFNARYPKETEEAPTIRYTRRITPYIQAEIFKACDCYEYQACETDDYEKTEAAKWIEKIRHVTARSLPGYDTAPWGID